MVTSGTHLALTEAICKCV